MQITVNGKTHEAPDEVTVRELLESLGLGKAVVAVERNRQIVPRREHDKAVLGPGDVLELVTLVGGG
jgi:thiamine biosynthesis protein ThiS